MGKVISLFGDGRRSRRPKTTATAAPTPPPPPSWLVAPEPELPRDPDRARRGAALCRSFLVSTDGGGVLDADDPRRDAALRRARAERRPSGGAA